MVHSRKEGLVHSGLTASIPGGDEAGGAGHTPGPWRAKSGSTPYPECDDADSWIAVLSPAGREVITLYERYSLAPDDRGCWEADARLIAAAPELLDDANRRVRMCEPCRGSGKVRKPHGFFMILVDCAACGPTRSAIAKAVGDVKRDADPIHRRDGAEGAVNQASLPSQSEVG